MGEKKALQWPSDSAERAPIDSIIPNPRNPRKHSAKQVAQVAASIQEWGFTNAILVDENNQIIAGHGRHEAALLLKLDEVPVIVAKGWPEAKKMAYLIADNKLGLNSEWDEDVLNVELQGLKAEGFDIELTGFDDFELEEIEPEDMGEPEVPEVVEPVTRLGDVWILGDHRLMCGDSTSKDAVNVLMDGIDADMVFTSPPYNANASMEIRKKSGSVKAKKVSMYSDGIADAMKSVEYTDFASSVLEVCFSVTDGFIFWNVSYNANSKFEYIKQIQGRLDHLVEQVCWKKSMAMPVRGTLKRDWEPIYIFSTEKCSLGVDVVTSNHWEVSNAGSQVGSHRACFPIALPEMGIDIVKKKTGVVFEPFSGAGTTMLACENKKRKCRGMELNPKFCDVSIIRWQEMTGKKAVLESTGESYDSLKK